MNCTRLLTLFSIIAFLVACGGGGGDDDANATNPWVNKAGTYSGCDDHTRRTVVFSPTGSNQAALSLREDIYDAAGCTGTIKGTITWSSPITATYLSTGLANVSGIVLPWGNTSLTIDRIRVSAPAMTQTLTGSGVNGRCVYYTNGNTCYDSLASDAATTEAGIYFKDNTFATLVINSSGIYVADTPILTKN